MMSTLYFGKSVPETFSSRRLNATVQLITDHTSE